jgi:hypothetical protein
MRPTMFAHPIFIKCRGWVSVSGYGVYQESSAPLINSAYRAIDSTAAEMTLTNFESSRNLSEPLRSSTLRFGTSEESDQNTS